MKKLLFILCATTVCRGAISCSDTDEGSGPESGNGSGIVGCWIRETYSENSYYCRILIFGGDGTHADKIQRTDGWEERRGRYDYEEESSELRIRYETKPVVLRTYRAQVIGNMLSCMDSDGRIDVYSRMK